MTMLKNLKIVVIVLSFAFFCVQFRLALLNLLDPPIIDSSYERDITVDDMPIITICPLNQTNKDMLSKLKYPCRESFTRGRVGLRTVSWGAHVNLTYEEVLKQLFDENVASQVYTANHAIRYIAIKKFC